MDKNSEYSEEKVEPELDYPCRDEKKRPRSLRRRWLSIKRTFLVLLVTVPLLVVLSILGVSSYYASKTIYDLLNENKELRKAITNLTNEDQIGYAKVLEQEENDNGSLTTRLLFVETARNDPSRRILERDYEIEGDMVYFDALIVKFSNKVVMDGTQKALYLWRRVYGETMPPGQGYPIEPEGEEPYRYAALCKTLSIRNRELFWDEIWKLSDDPDRLRDAGVRAIYGNVVYKKLRPGLIYVFKISNTGTVFPEVVPDL